MLFSADCKKTWHGAAEPCRRMRLSAELAERYLAIKGDPVAAVHFERIYGKKNLERLVHDLADEKLADEWRISNAQLCPVCANWIEKSMGCNHMQCSVCSCHFCFLCGEAIGAKNPYDHFGQRGSECYGKLFEGLTGLENDFIEFVMD